MTFKIPKLPSLKFRLPGLNIKAFSKLGKKEKVRLMAYIFTAVVIGFIILPSLTTSQFPTQTAQRSGTKQHGTQQRSSAEQAPSISELKVELIGAIGLSLKSMNNNDWSILQYSDKIRFREKITTTDADGRLLLKVNTKTIIGLGGNSSMVLDKKENSRLLIKLTSGCVGVRSASAHLAETVFIAPADGNPESVNLQNKKVVCLNESNQLTESSDNVFIPENFFYADYLPLSAIQPCDSVIELKKNENQASVQFIFSAPALMKKLIDISQTENFSSVIYQGSDFGPTHSSPMLNEGTYYWRVKDEYNKTTGSKTCKLVIVKSRPITVSYPSNEEVITDGAVSFNWKTDAPADSNFNITISGNMNFTNNVLTKDLNSNSFSIDDILQTLGPGTFFWKIKTKDGKESAIKKFYVLSENDFRIISPANGANISPSSKYVFFSWPALPLVKTYTALVSTNPSFSDTSYVASTGFPLTVSSILPNGDYFVRLTAVFTNNNKLTNNSTKFSISDMKRISLLRPSTDKTNYLRLGKSKRTFNAIFEWEKIPNASLYVIKLNTRLPINIKKGVTTAILPVAPGENTISIDAFCDNGTKLCARTDIMTFRVMEDSSPVLLWPKYGEMVYSDPKGNMKIMWKKIPRKEVEYELAEDKDFKNILASGISGSNIGVARLTPGDVYIRLRIKGAEWGSTVRFSIAPALPGVPVILAPSNRKIFRTKKAVFEWNPTRGAEGYQIEIAFDPKFKKIYKTQSLKEIKTQFILKHGKYFWRIFSFDSITGSKRYSRSSKPRIIMVKGR